MQKKKLIVMTQKIRLDMWGGFMVGGKMECDVNRGTAERAKRELDMTIGRNPVTGKVTSKAELAGGDKATNKLEAAQMNFGKAEQALKDAEEAYEGDRSVKNSRRVDKARKAFEQAQLDLEAAEEIKEKADKKKDK
jgi:putative lipoprotein